MVCPNTKKLAIVALVIIVVVCTFSMAHHNLSRIEGHIYFLEIDLHIDNLSKNATVIHLTEEDFSLHPVLKRILVEEYDSPIRGAAIAKYPLFVRSMPAVSPDEAAAILEKYFAVAGGGKWRYVEYDRVYYEVAKGQP